MSGKELLDLINAAKEELKKDKVIKDMCKEYDVSVDILDLVPIKFGSLEVSARTDHGIITLNKDLLDNFKENTHYLVHELDHYLQSTLGSRPTKGAKDGDYLENPDEISAFQPQLKYIEEHKGEEKAEEYADQVLDHHNVDDKAERSQKRSKLLKMVKEE